MKNWIKCDLCDKKFTVGSDPSYWNKLQDHKERVHNQEFLNK